MLSGALRRRKSGVSCRALRKEIHNDKKKSKLTHVVSLAQMPYTSIPAQCGVKERKGLTGKVSRNGRGTWLDQCKGTNSQT